MIADTASFSNGALSASIPSCYTEWNSDGQELNGQKLIMLNTSCAINESSEPDQDVQRFLVCAMNARTEQVPGFGNPDDMPDYGSAGAGPGYTIIGDPISCLICSPRYSIRLGEVTVVGQNATNVTFLDDHSEGRQITGLSSWQMGMSVFHSLGATPPLAFLGINEAGDLLDLGNEVFLSLLEELNSAVAGNFEKLYDAKTLQNASSTTFRMLSAQVALLNFMSPTNETDVQMSFVALENRLYVQPATFIAMAVILCTLFLISVLVAFLIGHRHDLPKGPSTILGLAAVMARSPSFNSEMNGTAHFSSKDLEDKLARTRYNTPDPNDAFLETFSINVHPDNAKETPSSVFIPPPVWTAGVGFWTPFAMTRVGRGLLCVIPLIICAAILGLLIRSKKDHGIAEVPSASSFIHYGWTLLPATVLVGVATLFEKLNSSIRVLQLFSELSHERPIDTRGKSLMDYNGLLALQSLWYAARHRHLAVLASTFATLVAPFLTIVVSGLFRYVVRIVVNHPSMPLLRLPIVDCCSHLLRF